MEIRLQVTNLQYHVIQYTITNDELREKNEL